MGTRKGRLVDSSSVVGEVSGLVIISVVTSSAVSAIDVGVDAVIVRTVTVSVGVVLSVIAVVPVEVGGEVVKFLGVVPWVDAVEAVGLAVLGGGCGEGEVRGVGVEVAGGDVDVGKVRVVKVGGNVVEAGGVGEGGEEVRETEVASVDVVEGVTVAATVATTVEATVAVDVLSLVTVSGGVA